MGTTLHGTDLIRTAFTNASLAVLMCLISSMAIAGEIKVAAASNLTYAVQDLAKIFQEKTGNRVRLSFGSSGNFARQISRGAPFNIFISANRDYVDRLEAAGIIRGKPMVIGVGRLVLFYPHNSRFESKSEMAGVEKLLAKPNAQLTIANPEHAPYGIAAREVLENLGHWSSALPRLVIGENASQATRFTASGAVDMGIIPYSLAKTQNVQQRGTYSLIPANLHSPLQQTAVLIGKPNKTADAFFAYLQSESGRAVLARYGFDTDRTSEEK